MNVCCNLTVHVTPNAKQSAVVGWQEDGSLKIRLAAKPVDGDANAELIAFLAQTLNLPKRAVTLTHGHTSRIKRVLVDGLEKSTLLALLTPQ